MRSQIAVLEAKVKALEEECDKATGKMNEMTQAISVLEEKVKRPELRRKLKTS
jgi:chromosome segregation ATPase